MKRKSIAIDLDSTLNNLDDVWTATLSKEYNYPLERSMMKNWNAKSWAPPGCENVYEPLNRPGFFRNLDVQPHAQEVTEWLSQHYDLYIATAFNPTTVVDKVEWVKEHFPHIDPRHIVFINPKYILNTDYLIDDGPHNIEAFKQHGILIDAPWNQELLVPKLQRVKDWNEIKTYFRFIRLKQDYPEKFFTERTGL